MALYAFVFLFFHTISNCILAYSEDLKSYEDSVVNAPILPVISNSIPNYSVILIQGTNDTSATIPQKNTRGTPVKIDWSQIPYLGFPKSDIKSISILKRRHVVFRGTQIFLAPDLWLFKSDTQSIRYEGLIPYLENLSFLSPESKKGLTTKTSIVKEQNPVGYYQDKKTGYTGVYLAMNDQNPTTINTILIISKDNQQEIIDTQSLLDEINKEALLLEKQDKLQDELKKQKALEELIKDEDIEKEAPPSLKEIDEDINIVPERKKRAKDDAFSTSIEKRDNQ